VVPRPLLLRAALGAVTALTAGLLITPPASAAVSDPVPDPVPDLAPDVATDNEVHPVPEAYDAPLLVTIDELTPGEVPERGPVIVSGTVINRDVETWTGISLYPFINAGLCPGCPAPITTEAELVEAAATDPTIAVGNRVVDVSASVDSLEPGEVEPYSIRVPRALLEVTSPGVYWFGVHALGASESTPDDLFADGRARTFLPYVPRGTDGIRGEIDAAVVVPLRYPTRHLQTGAIAKVRDWVAAFEPTGELGGPLAFGTAAFGRPVTWLVDPAVPDAARLLRRGNPPRDPGPTETDAEDPGDDESPSEGASEEPEEPGPLADSPVAMAAQEWLDAVEVQIRDEEVLALPYGDLDMSATPEWMPALYPVARARTGDVLSAWETPTSPVIASPGGFLDPAGIAAIDDDSTLLITDRMFDESNYPLGPPAVGEYDDHSIVATSYGAATGGPGPEPRLAPIAFRQRVLAEAALRLITPGQRRPLIVVVPLTVDSEGATSFWTGLDPGWLNLTTVEDAVDRPATTVEPDTLTYPAGQETAELDSTVFYEAQRLIEAGSTLQNLLVDADEIAAGVRDEALTGASYHFRTDPTDTANRLENSRLWIERQLRSIGIDGPPGVTLSSADGSFAVTVTNDLDRTVTVQLEADSIGDEVSIDVGDPVVLAAESRTTILLDAHTKGAGVHNVTLSVTDVDGTPLGSSVEVPIRSGQVSEVIWVILGVGGGILFVAIALRLIRRFRRHRREEVA
jgi:hypothetical protein